MIRVKISNNIEIKLEKSRQQAVSKFGSINIYKVCKRSSYKFSSVFF